MSFFSFLFSRSFFFSFRLPSKLQLVVVGCRSIMCHLTQILCSVLTTCVVLTCAAFFFFLFFSIEKIIVVNRMVAIHTFGATYTAGCFLLCDGPKAQTYSFTLIHIF